jgi:hypothetical protein
MSEIDAQNAHAQHASSSTSIRFEPEVNAALREWQLQR